MNKPKIVEYMNYISKAYEEAKEGTGVFWDIVAVTASDSAQAQAYSAQLVEKQRQSSIPDHCDYVVYSDPPGNKAGSGGSTLHVLDRLQQDFGVSTLTDRRVLVLSAGGHSQRLVSASVLGKLFTALPMTDKSGSQLLQIVELKMALYLPLLRQNMPPGVFLASSDTIEVYSLDRPFTFAKGGFTAMAHPSSLEVACGHGVFVLQSSEEDVSIDGQNSALSTSTPDQLGPSVRRVLQKPSVELMVREKCVFRCRRKTETDQGAANGDASSAEFAYTDSCYFMDSQICMSLLKFYDSERPLQCEICAYGDFMRPLGISPSSDYLTTSTNPELSRIRAKLYDLLKNTSLNIIRLDNSKFFHLGTMNEYTEHLTHSSEVADYLGFSRAAILNLGSPASLSNSACVMHTYSEPGVIIGDTSVVEYCRLSAGCRIGVNCIVSSCRFPSSVSLVVPDHCFLHTIAVKLPRHGRHSDATAGDKAESKSTSSPVDEELAEEPKAAFNGHAGTCRDAVNSGKDASSDGTNGEDGANRQQDVDRNGSLYERQLSREHEEFLDKYANNNRKPGNASTCLKGGDGGDEGVDEDEDEDVGYVCVGLSVNDDVKATFCKPKNVLWFGKQLGDKFQDTKINGNNSPIEHSLWTAGLFQVCSTMEDAVEATLALIAGQLTNGDANDEESWPVYNAVSIREAILSKHAGAMLSFRGHLGREISESFH